VKKIEKVSPKNDDGFNFTYGLTYLRALDCPKLYSYKIGNGNSVFLHPAFIPRILLSSSTVFRFSIQIASIGPSPQWLTLTMSSLGKWRYNLVWIAMNTLRVPGKRSKCCISMRGCSSVAKWMQTSTQWSSNEMDTLKKCEKKTSKVSAHQESIHHLNSHQWHLMTTGSMVSIFTWIFEIRCWMHLSHHTFAHQWSPGNHPIKAF